MFVTVSRFGRDTPYKFCRKSTDAMQAVFGDLVKRVFIDASEHAVVGVVGKDGDWSGLDMVVELPNARYVRMTNSEWADFTAVTVKTD